MKKYIVSLSMLAALLLLNAHVDGQPTKKAKHAAVKNAVAIVRGFGSHPVKGVLHFTEKDGVVWIKGEISGLKPGKHGFHIHEFGDTSSGEAKCAGGHFNPDGKKHAGPTAENRHVGDLGNISADGRGKVKIDMKDHLIKLNGSHSIIGRAVIIHEKADDLKSQPSGDAGARVAGGVVGISGSMAGHK